MANSAKDKGDRFERAAVSYLLETSADLVSVKRPQRMLGAGRKEDVGDIHVFNDVAIQVRALKDMGQAVRSSAVDSVAQAANGDLPHSLGMVPVPRARAEQVRWLASAMTDCWPEPVVPVAEFALISKALLWLRDDQGPHGYQVWPRIQRIALLRGSGTPVLVAPMEAWIGSYRHVLASAQPLSAA